MSFVKGVDGRVKLLCLNLDYKLGKSYVIKAPTGSGKTTWVLLEVFKKVLENSWKCFYTTSLRMGNEDVYRKAVKLYGVDKVGKVDGSVKDLEIRQREWSKPIVLTTFEELLIYFRRLYMRNEKISKNIVVIIDEFHHVLDKLRVVVLLQILAFCKMWNIPVILMSATFPEAENVARYVKGFYMSFGSNLTNKEIKLVKTSDKEIYAIVARLVKDVLSKYRDINIVVFYESRNGLKRLHKLLNEYGLRSYVCYRGLEELPNIIEKFVKREVNILLTTSVIGEAINLPIDVGVIIVNDLVTSCKLVQMIGRVGRYGLTKLNKSLIYIVYTSRFEETVLKALREDYGRINLCELDDVVLTYLLQPLTLDKLVNLLRNTYGVSFDEYTFSQTITKLLRLGLIEQKIDSTYQTTKLGQLLVKYNIYVNEFLKFLNCFKKYNNIFDIVVCTLLHLGEVEPEYSIDRLTMCKEELKNFIKEEELNVEIQEVVGLREVRKTTRLPWLCVFNTCWLTYIDHFYRWIRFTQDYVLTSRKRLKILTITRKILTLLDKFYKIRTCNEAKEIVHELVKTFLTKIQYT